MTVLLSKLRDTLTTVSTAPHSPGMQGEAPGQVLCLHGGPLGREYLVLRIPVLT